MLLPLQILGLNLSETEVSTPIISFSGGSASSLEIKKFLDKVKLRQTPLNNQNAEDEILEIVDDVIDETEALEAQGEGQSEDLKVPGQEIAKIAKKRALARQSIVRNLRKSEKISAKIAQAQIESRINELVRQRRKFFKVENEDIQAIIFILGEIVWH